MQGRGFAVAKMHCIPCITWVFPANLFGFMLISAGAWLTANILGFRSLMINCGHVLWPVGFLMRMVCTSVVAALSDRRCTESSHHGYGVDLLQNMRKVTELICFTVTECNDVMVKPHILSLLQRFWLITITKPAKCDDNEYGNPHIWSQNVAAINQFNTVHSTTLRNWFVVSLIESKEP